MGEVSRWGGLMIYLSLMIFYYLVDASNSQKYQYLLYLITPFMLLSFVEDTFNNVNGTEIPYQIYPRREGDVESCFADATKIRNQLDWYASRNLSMMCEDAYHFAIKKKKL